MLLSRLLPVCIIAMSLVACTASEDASDDFANQEEELNVQGSPEQVTWTYRDAVGRHVEVEAAVPGSVSVRFVGGARPLAGSSTTLQTAVVDLVLPTIANPNTLTTRRFFVRLESSDGGQTYISPSLQFLRQPVGSTIDASLPGAIARFNATYSASTLRARPDSAYVAPIRSFDLRLTKRADGSGYGFKATVSAYGERNFALHTTTLTAEKS